MKITDVNVKLVENETVKARVSVTFDNVFVIHNLRLIEGSKGMFVSMPAIKTQKGTFLEMAYPINAEFSKEINEKVMEAYQNALENKKKNQEAK